MDSSPLSADKLIDAVTNTRQIFAASSTVSPTPITGDVNLDGIVGIADVMALKRNPGNLADSSWTDGDINRDGRVNIADIALVVNNYGAVESAVFPSAPAAVVASTTDRVRNPSGLRAKRFVARALTLDAALLDVSSDNTAQLRASRAIRSGRS